MKIHFGNQTHDVEVKSTLAKFIDEKVTHPKHYAVAVNHHYIPRHQYANTLLQEGDRIVLITPMQGG